MGKCAEVFQPPRVKDCDGMQWRDVCRCILVMLNIWSCMCTALHHVGWCDAHESHQGDDESRWRVLASENGVIATICGQNQWWDTTSNTIASRMKDACPASPPRVWERLSSQCMHLCVCDWASRVLEHGKLISKLLGCLLCRLWFPSHVIVCPSVQ